MRKKKINLTNELIIFTLKIIFLKFNIWMRKQNKFCQILFWTMKQFPSKSPLHIYQRMYIYVSLANGKRFLEHSFRWALSLHFQARPCLNLERLIKLITRPAQSLIPPDFWHVQYNKNHKSILFLPEIVEEVGTETVIFQNMTVPCLYCLIIFCQRTWCM